MKEEELKEIEKRWAESQKGPWKSFIEGRDHTSGSNFIMIGEGDDRTDDIELLNATIADYDFIASAKQDIPRLLNEVRRLQNLIDDAK